MTENPADGRGDASRRIGVYICHCGGNISDYVDVAAVRAAVADDPDVVVATTTMFACADGQQHEMVRDIREQRLDGLVVASCSPKLHTTTFRGVSRRADLNPYAYTQVKIREQPSGQCFADAGPRRCDDGDETAQRHSFLPRPGRSLCATA